MLIVNYREDWINHFEGIQEKLSGALVDVCVRIEHIGSTAVPGLAAKPIIDIDVIYNEMTDFERIRNGLEAIGYVLKGDQGVAGREAFKRNGGGADEILDIIAHHLYVCRYDCAELHRHILFRDYLRKHETAREFYQNLKREIAQEANDDRKRYASIKEVKARSFINYIVKVARIESSEFGKIDC